MKNIIFAIFTLLLISCKENRAETENSVSNPTNQLDSSNDTIKAEHSLRQLSNNLVNKTFKNFTFQIPDDFKIQENLSTNDKQVYIEDAENIGLTIDAGNLENEVGNGSIKSLVKDLKQFSESINQDNKRHFSDFELLDSKFDYLGNKESVVVNQTSTKISDVKNLKMMVISHFVTSSPYYYSFSFSYPIKSIKAKEAVSKIIKSFKFEENLPKNQSKTNTEVTNETSIKRPNEFETKKWILEKFKAYGNPDFSYQIQGYNLLVTTSTNRDIAIEYAIPLCDCNAYINTSHTFSGERITISTNTSRIKINRNWKGFPKYENSFDFDFRFSSENNLIERLNKAFDNLKLDCPKITRNETF